MALPALTAFEDFLAATRVVAAQPASGASELIQRSADSVRGPGVEVWLSYPTGVLQLDSILRKIGEELKDVGAASTRAIAIAVLALVAGTKGTEGHVEHVKSFFVKYVGRSCY